MHTMDKQDEKDTVDASLLRVPFESLKRAAKDRKAFVDDTSEALSKLAAVSSSSPSEQLEQLDQLVSRLQGLKRKLVDVGKQEADEAMRCKARLEHLKLVGKPTKGHVIAWSKQRLDRIIIDHMLRTGIHNSAGVSPSTWFVRQPRGTTWYRRIHKKSLHIALT